MSMAEWVEEKPDFAAALQFRTAEGGRKTPPLQGYRCDFQYADDPKDQAWMIYPCFLDLRGRPFAPEVSVPAKVDAHFRILDPQLRATEHAKRLREGTRFFLVEGARRVADGIVTELLAVENSAG
jgi:hypothetical protein